MIIVLVLLFFGLMEILYFKGMLENLFWGLLLIILLLWVRGLGIVVCFVGVLCVCRYIIGF